MPRPTRRDFLKTASVGALVTIAGTKSSPRVLGANETVRIAVAGINGRGKSHVDAWTTIPGVQLTYLIDPHKGTYGKYTKRFDGKPDAPKFIQDVRQALEDKNLDAISIATPNHWHALMTIWACQAGKDVYVEKPASHNVHEGAIAVEAARKHNRIVQHGTQSRSSGSWAAVAELAKSGKYGKLLVSRGLVYKSEAGKATTRGDIGFRPEKAPPSELDFNIWTGPAPKQPYHENLVHYRWHWFWDFGNGDIGNQGVHQMDIARWMIPGATFPKSVISLGGRIGHKDQGQCASTQLAVMDYGDTKLIFEVRGLPSKLYPHAGNSDNVLHFEEGTVAGGRFYPKGKDEGEPVAGGRNRQRGAAQGGKSRTKGPGGPPAEGDSEGGHFGNFIKACRSRKVEDLKADILEGHRSAALIHLVNASQRLGDQVPFNSGAAKSMLNGNVDAAEALDRMEEYLAKENNIKLTEWSLTVGKKLTVDAGNGFTSDPAANKLLTREYRAPFVVPAKL
ncbi:MAG TPA: Gfo/Idh/MocA family oxidoreductase [Gemmataceae bacterium]|nr:Gfo/Idh/MocA family oxidoreductase [Gemmataceae bacterium]